MRKHEHYPDFMDLFEYYGTSEIVRIRKRNGRPVRQDWLIFESAEQALVYFNTRCGEFNGVYG